MNQHSQDTNLSNDYGKIPPQAIDIEEVFLGALLLDGKSFEGVNSLLPPEAFYSDAHQKIYKCMELIVASDSKIDSLTVLHKLKSKGQLEEVGGATYISSLTARVGGSSHIKHHAAIIYDKWIAREMIRIGTEMVTESYDEEVDIMDLIQHTRNEIDKRVLHLLGIQSIGISIIDAAQQSIEDYYTREKNVKEGKIVGVPTTLTQVNVITGGMQKGDLIILAGRPSMGKTSIAISFMRTAATFGMKCAFFSLEMTAIRLTDKIVCAEAEIDLTDYKRGRLTDEDKLKADNSLAEIEKMKVTFNDNMVVNIEQVHASCKMLKDRDGLDIIFIDYLQLMKTKERAGSREQEISTMTRKAKIMAKDLNVPVVLLSQLNRGLEQRANKEPVLSDLRESGAIEQDADIVMFAYRDHVYNDESPDDEGKIIIAKHREGAIGYVEFKHNKAMTKISDFYRSENRTENIIDMNQRIEQGDIPF
jgi:replicative DNA helicase